MAIRPEGYPDDVRRFLNHEYLREGTPRHYAAWETLRRARVFEELAEYRPTLAGTVPLEVDTKDSDLDVLCEAYALDDFERRLQKRYGRHPSYLLRRAEKQGLPSVLCSFQTPNFRIEIFGQPQPVTEQQAFRHLVVESRLLALAGNDARRAIRALKTQGSKTEPAFASYFGLEGDPYQTLLALYGASKAELRRIVEARGTQNF